MKKRTRKNNGIEEEEDSGDEEDLVRQIGTSVYFHAPVTKKTILLLLEKLSAAETVSLQQSYYPSSARIQLFIHSEGGDAYAGLSGMDHIERCRVPVDTIADGFVASAATFLLLAGKRRYGMPNSVLLIHQLSTGFWGKYAELMDEVANSEQLMKKIRSIYEERTGMDKKKIDHLLTKELTLSCEECVSSYILEVYNPQEW
jgi:ATP-dependent protease ClpP protease subunit